MRTWPWWTWMVVVAGCDTADLEFARDTRWFALPDGWPAEARLPDDAWLLSSHQGPLMRSVQAFWDAPAAVQDAWLDAQLVGWQRVPSEFGVKWVDPGCRELLRFDAESYLLLYQSDPTFPGVRGVTPAGWPAELVVSSEVVCGFDLGDGDLSVQVVPPAEVQVPTSWTPWTDASGMGWRVAPDHSRAVAAGDDAVYVVGGVPDGFLDDLAVARP